MFMAFHICYEQSKLLQGNILGPSFLIAVQIHYTVMEKKAVSEPFLVDMRTLFQSVDVMS